MAARMWWIIRKDLLTEWRTLQVWPAMLLLGLIVTVLFAVQMELLPEQREQIVGGLLWLSLVLAGMPALDRSCAAEGEEGCWEALLNYPISPATVYLAKLAVNVVSLAILQGVLIALFAGMSQVSLLSHPWAMVLVALLGNVGLASLGTLLAGLSSGSRKNGHLLALLVLPMVFPLVLAAAEATRLIAAGDLGTGWQRWVGLLGASAVIFITAGIVLFEFIVEE